ncbi:MAG: DUF2585 family protein [Promethearchaeota archaeon]|nr:MAG: DUF2585 family protein [Candidatus Lokiarchaeota archaeon]
MIIRILAKTRDDISKTAIDCFSFMHLMFGYFGFLFFNFMFFFTIGNFLNGFSLLFIIFFSIIWELTENIVLIRFNIKFGNRKDSVFNSGMDITFFLIGGCIGLISFYLEFRFFLILMLSILYGMLVISFIYYIRIKSK